MKKVLEKAGELLLYIVLIPLVVVFGVGLVFYIPVDYVRYRRSAFYRDTKQKYDLFSDNTPWIRLYNIMRAEGLPLDFHLHTTDEVTCGYFRYHNILLVQDYPVEYEPVSGDWFVHYEEADKEACTFLTEALENEVEGFNEIVGQKCCDRAVLLVDRTQSPEEDLPHLESCELLLGYDGRKGMAVAIRQWIEKIEENQCAYNI